MKKYIIFDASVFINGTKSGVYRVTHQIIQELCTRANLKVALFIRENYAEFANDTLKQLFPLAELIIENSNWVPPEGSMVISTFHQPPECWSNFPGLARGAIIYDVLPLTNPEFFTPGLVLEIQRTISSLDSTTAIFAISKFTKHELLKIRPDLNSDNVHVMHLAAESAFEVAKGTTNTHESIRSNGKFFLTVGTVEPRKNLIGAIKSFNLLMENHPDSDVSLVIAGGSGWSNSEIYREAKKSRHRKRIKFLGYVSESELTKLYQDAEALIFLSHLEGFGLPLVEAMACGTPIVASNTSSMLEVLGPAGLKVSPTDYKLVAKYMQGILTNQSLKHDLIEASLSRSADFTWSSTASTLLNVMTKKLKTLQRSRANLENLDIKKAKRRVQKKPLISYITVVKNAEKTIARTLESVANQTYKNVEHIVIDGKSTDGTLSEIQKFKKKLAYYTSEKDSGIYDAINKGISASTGDIVCVLNADDWLDPTAAATIFEVYKGSDKSNTIFCSTASVDTEQGNVIWRPEKVTDAAIVTCANVCHNAIYATRDVYESVGKYRTDLKIAADFEWIMRCHDFGTSFRYLDSVTTHYSLGGASSDSFKHQIECRRIMMERFPSLSQVEATKLQDAFFHFSKGRLSPGTTQPRRELLFGLLEKHNEDLKLSRTIAMLSVLNSRNRNPEPGIQSAETRRKFQRLLDQTYIKLTKYPRALRMARSVYNWLLEKRKP